MRSIDVQSSFQHLHLQDCRGLERRGWRKRKTDRQVSELRVVGYGENYESPEPGARSVSHLSSHWESLKILWAVTMANQVIRYCAKHVIHISSLNPLGMWALLLLSHFKIKKLRYRDAQDHVTSKGQGQEWTKQPGFRVYSLSNYTLPPAGLSLTWGAGVLLLESAPGAQEADASKAPSPSSTQVTCVFFVLRRCKVFFIFVLLFFRMNFCKFWNQKGFLGNLWLFQFRNTEQLSF